MREVLLERAAAGGGEAVFGPRHAARERLLAGDVLRVFELAGVDAQVAVGRVQQPLEIVERQPIVDGQRADDAEAEALVDEPIERERTARSRAGGLATDDRLALADLPTGGCRLLALPAIFPRNDQTEADVKAAKAGGHEQWPHAAGAANASAPSAMKQSPMTGTMRTDSAPPVATAAP